MVIKTLNKKAIQEDEYYIWNSFIELVVSESFEDLNDIQKSAYLCFWYDSEVMNGGHLQYFENRGTGQLTDTVAALAQIGANKQAELLEEAYKVYSANERKPIHTIQDYVDVAADDEFDGIDARFYESKPQIQEVLEKYVNEHVDQFFEII
jgi:hypothetical protein